MSLDTEPRRRQIDRSNAEARRAVADTLAQFASWRLDLARFQCIIDRHSTEAERRVMLERCAAIEDELLMARTELIASLADAPHKVTGNSRVVDVERALDDVEATVARLRRRLTQ